MKNKKILALFLIFAVTLSLFSGCSLIKNKHTVTFNESNGNSSYTVTVDSLNKLTKPADPVRYGYVFDGWFLGSLPFDFDTPITEDITLTAKWSGITSTLVFDAMGGELDLTSVTVTYGGSLVKPVPTKENYVFLGWFIDDSTPFNFNNIKIVTDTIIYAKWEPEAPSNTYTVIFNKNNGEDIISLTLNKGDLIPKPIDPIRTGYDFDGWFVDGNILFDFETSKINQNTITLMAKWSPKQFTVTFDVNGGTIDNPTMMVEYGNSYNIPTPTKVGYDFDGWFNGNELFNFKNIQILEDITLVAKWKAKEFTITFDAKDGLTPQTMVVKYGETITAPIPTNDGYDFGGWFMGNEKFSFENIQILEDITLVAKWGFSITYVLNGGTNIPKNPEFFVTTDKTFYIYAPTRDGYDFEGWYLNSDFTGDVVMYINPKNETGSITLYAKWKKSSGTISPPY
ncbi:MAG: hypothetical protein E7342_05470 [Clostridiales bacterium]|nr:hypothetical protein [Clostridiales bacterium]